MIEIKLKQPVKKLYNSSFIYLMPIMPELRETNK